MTVMALILDEEEGSVGDESALMEQQGNSGGINPHAPPFYPNNNNGASENSHMGDGDQDKENNINNLNNAARVRQVWSHKQTHLLEILFKALRSERDAIRIPICPGFQPDISWDFLAKLAAMHWAVEYCIVSRFVRFYS